MSNTNLPPFYVGQKVVALTTGYFHEKGHVYTIADMMFCDKCKKWHALTKETTLMPASKYKCDCYNDLNTTIYLGGDAKYFAPIEENFQSITLEKVMEKETPLIGVN